MVNVIRINDVNIPNKVKFSAILVISHAIEDFSEIASRLSFWRNKWKDKSYIRHTGYPGGQRSLTATEMFEKDPTRLIEKAVKGMLPKNTLGSALFRNLYVYAGAEHKQAGQEPKAINLNDYK